MSQHYIKSPLNYTGGKHRLLPQIMPLFPKKINAFYDLFAGGFNVGINVDANRIIYNDKLEQVKDLLLWLNNIDIDEVLEQIDEIISHYELSKINKGGYLDLRVDYNENKCSLDLYVLIAHSFNNQIRFNKKGEFNVPFGKRTFYPVLRQRFIEFVEVLQSKNVGFLSHDFRNFTSMKHQSDDFVYCDPPYLLSTATYNESGGWVERDELDLLHFLDMLDGQDIKFALSNVLESKGNENRILKEWAKKHNVHHLNASYSNCSYQRGKGKLRDVEVLITNY